MQGIQPIILSGGSGTRLWPLSREEYPKQLLALTGGDTLLQSTALRLDAWRGKSQLAPPIIVSNEEYRFITAEQFRRIRHRFGALILEPAGRNTAPALTVAAHMAMAEGDDPILLVMPADQLVQDPVAFCKAVELGAELAAKGAVVTFGITPERPETGYGYLHLGEQAANSLAWHLDSFVEKPDQATASRYAADDSYLWNAGIFMLRASIWLAALERYAPAIAASCANAFRFGVDDGEFYRLGREAFLASPADSIDYAVMEKLAADRAANAPMMVIPIEVGWSDVGAWDALWQIADKNATGNYVSGDTLLEDVDNSLVISQGRLVACLGLRDMVVIETPDAVFVASRERANDVRKIVARLKSTGRSEASNHRKRQRPWGYYDSIDCGERFHVKRIVVNPKASLSLQMHHHRAEHWVVVRGTAKVTRGSETFLLGENESTFIPLGVQHRLENPGKLPLEMIEVQSGPYLGEDDIVRFVDTYGRVAASLVPAGRHSADAGIVVGV